MDAGYGIASITLHRGEEPVLGGQKGICNVFFGHCNLSCSYCQNYQISRNTSPVERGHWSLEHVLDEVGKILDQGVSHLGFVSPSHMIPQMVAIIAGVRQRGYRPVVVYNSNGYDRVEVLRELEELVDVYLPDCKYMDRKLAARLSGAGNYPDIAGAALAEMYRQKGSVLHCDDQGHVCRGLIVRHLVLPGQVQNSLDVLSFLANTLSVKVSLSLMSQYAPVVPFSPDDCLGRTISSEEYNRVVAEMERLGFINGWLQEFSSAEYYSPDFTREHPFAD